MHQEGFRCDKNKARHRVNEIHFNNCTKIVELFRNLLVGFL